MDADSQRLLQIVDLAASRHSSTRAGRRDRHRHRTTSDASTRRNWNTPVRITVQARDNSDPGDPTTAVINCELDATAPDRPRLPVPEPARRAAAHRRARLRRRDRRTVVTIPTGTDTVVRQVRQRRLHDPGQHRRLHDPPHRRRRTATVHDRDHHRRPRRRRLDRRRRRHPGRLRGDRRRHPAARLPRQPDASRATTRHPRQRQRPRQLPRRGLRGRPARHASRPACTGGLHGRDRRRRRQALHADDAARRLLPAPVDGHEHQRAHPLGHLGRHGDARVQCRRRRPERTTASTRADGQLARRRLPRGPVGRDLRRRGTLRPGEDPEHPRHQRRPRRAARVPPGVYGRHPRRHSRRRSVHRRRASPRSRHLHRPATGTPLQDVELDGRRRLLPADRRARASRSSRPRTHLLSKLRGPLAVEGGVTGADRSLAARPEAARREGRPAVRDRDAGAGVQADRRAEHLQRRQPGARLGRR